jgi:hypothetical protein
MNYRYDIITICARCICFLFLTSFIIHPLLSYQRSIFATTGSVHITPALRVIVIPLDSRPPCRDYPGQLASIANVEVLVPPPGYLDYYRTPADTQALSDWLTAVGPSADAVIISTDALMHGGLLASRIPQGSLADAERTLRLIELFHQQNPHIPIYAFSIIPRLLISDTPENQPYKSAMAEFSMLKDKVALFNRPDDQARLLELQAVIPFSIQDRYQNMYTVNTWFNERLMMLAAAGTLRHLVLGQDDAHPYGMANMVKRDLDNWLTDHPTVENITITRGTDEVAASILARLITDSYDYTPRIFVHYSSPLAATVVMPFMPSTVEQTVAEKIKLVKGVRVATANEADFILYIHVGTPKTPAGVMIKAAQEVNRYLKDGRAVSLVDLSETYDPDKNLFPFLYIAQIDFSKLASYAGWNTTSNSVGTAIAQATIRQHALRHGLFIAENQYAFLFQRLLDDWYYQKQVQPEVNRYLSRQDIANTNLGMHYETANRFVQKKLAYYANSLYSHHFAKKNHDTRYINNMQFHIQLPWPRTFEVQADISVTLEPYVLPTAAKQSPPTRGIFR